VIVEIATAAGLASLRPETPDDTEFRLQLFCDSRPDDWSRTGLDRHILARLMREQFSLQTRAYLMEYPAARFEIIELDGVRCGRMVTDRAAAALLLVDLALTPGLRRRGIGSAVLGWLCGQAHEAGVPLRLNVASANSAALRFYARLGFVQTAAAPLTAALEWRGS
jgi:GNAT superfamily N-acetyltransferase